MLAIAAGATSPATAQACTRQGTDVSCDDGKRGVFTGDAINWADGSRRRRAAPCSMTYLTATDDQ